ncbi:hypothetical protein [Roseateles terrae]|uniref:Type IV pilus biogenesis protein PilP n=1 Tax=Roseateles terrae TaxID=431060 RepID=A0ABR6GLN5_9BURK|nr:hypothetical protein [Roseateles terrae]MBB3192970.1 hypothetical protein [Roseateles terrae]OWQ89781.1 hypothetical protein CDN98_04520 [Roseateles terrae]
MSRRPIVRGFLARIARIVRLASARRFSRAAGGLLAVSLAQFAVAPAAVAAEDGTTASSTSMQQIIDAARRKKAQELDAAARRMLGNEIPPAAPGPSAMPPPPPATKHSEVPRVWSLTGVGQRLQAELFYEGRIHRVAISPGHTPQVGPWQVRAITPSGVTVSLSGGSAAGGKAASSLMLPAPARGSSMGGFSFSGVGGGADPLPASALNSAALPPSALRASRLPLEGQMALSQQQGH